MKSITNLTGTITGADCSSHPIRQAVRHGFHSETSPGVFRFIGVWDKELHLHHGREMVVIPLSELWELAESAEPKFLEKPEKSLSARTPSFPVPPGTKQVSVPLK
jgi:hypothetical protein